MKEWIIQRCKHSNRYIKSFLIDEDIEVKRKYSVEIHQLSYSRTIL